MLNEFSGYILAGGKSSRMGRDKAFLKYGEKTFLENAVEILRPVCESRVKIVLNQDQIHFIAKLPPKIAYVFDIYKNRGALGGIHAAFNDCQTKYAVILAVDLPFVTNEVFIKLAETLSDSPEFSAIIPKQNNSKLQPLCGIYIKNDCLPKLENLLNNNASVSVHQFLEKINTKVIKYVELQTDSRALFNVNFSEDYENL